MSEDLQHSVEAPAEEISASGIAADAAPGVGAPPADEPADRPAGVPEKFWDREAGAIRMEALLKSYVELERKLGSMVPLPGDDDQEGRERLRRALGVPDSPEHYRSRSATSWSSRPRRSTPDCTRRDSPRSRRS